jgi:glycerol-3-phosphate cytidylyltransferase
MSEKIYKIGYVPGVFDLFHIGHLNLIRKSKNCSEYLIAGVLTDELVEHFKGKRPVIPFEERFEIVKAIREVDEVVPVDFSNTKKLTAWELYHFDAYFSGDDHGNEWKEEQEKLRALGSDIVFFPYTKSTSSTMLKAKLGKKHHVYIMGAGRIGRRCLNSIRTESAYRDWVVDGFLDNSADLHLTKIEGIVVYRPEDVLRLEQDADSCEILLAVKDREPVEKQLRELGLSYSLWKG